MSTFWRPYSVLARSLEQSISIFSIANEPLAGGGLGSHRNWLQGLDSPLIQPSEEGQGQKELKLRFDVSQYSPEEIVVKTVDNKLLVSVLSALW